MSITRKFIFFGAFFLAIFWSACKDDFDNYSANPNDRLSFSVDTLRFDTILSTINTSVNAFMVYNRNKKPLLISSIRLRNADAGGYKINVDGRAGASFQDVEIRVNDSLYVFVDIKPKENGINQLLLITDYIDFTTNGVQQSVVLEAHTQDVTIWKGLTIFSDTILTGEKPCLIYDSLVIAESASVKVEAGATWFMHAKAEIIVKGRLQLLGTLEKPVTIRGDRMDRLVGVSYDLIPGQWGGIRIDSTSFNNVFEHARIRNAYYGLDLRPSEPDESKLFLKNVVLTNCKGTLVNSVNCRFTAENCEFSNARGALLDLMGGDYEFTHCTLANYYGSPAELGWGSTNNETVILSTTEDYPSEEAIFRNTIIWGSKANGSSGIRINPHETGAITFRFDHCLLPDEGEDDNDFIQCIWNKNPKFVDIDYVKNNQYEFFYDFRLDSISPARNAADPVYSIKLPYDLNGVDRFADGEPDLGAYEWRIEN
ncbi:MAG: hypothetical protein LBN18_08470 [Dysgonamonadaceae bacterium]|jgi:hypothetical protein|nr:hypothetical protein [Dysgonamonadaceae bacterium]